MFKRDHENAVSPVVGVMLMLVVVIIIAAIVSAFSGGMVSGQKKVPSASITGKFSLSTGFEIIHAGGEGLPTADTEFVIRNGPMFGANLEQKSAQKLNKSIIGNSKGQYLINADGSLGAAAFIPGETLIITGANSTCSMLQPDIGTLDPTLCLSSSDNIGKIFTLDVSDNRGNLISSSEVTITP